MERTILDAIEAAAERGEQAAVATVVSTIRSAPRQPGAKYVVTESGTYVGSVSGGCVESDVAERAQQVFAGGPANLIHYGVSDAAALEKNARYIGAVGAKRTAERRRTRLAEQGFSDEQIARIHGPAGLDLGGRAPAQVALAIAAQIVAETSGGVKKDK